MASTNTASSKTSATPSKSPLSKLISYKPLKTSWWKKNSTKKPLTTHKNRLKTLNNNCKTYWNNSPTQTLWLICSHWERVTTRSWMSLLKRLWGFCSPVGLRGCKNLCKNGDKLYGNCIRNRICCCLQFFTHANRYKSTTRRCIYFCSSFTLRKFWPSRALRHGLGWKSQAWSLKLLIFVSRSWLSWKRKVKRKNKKRMKRMINDL